MQFETLSVFQSLYGWSLIHIRTLAAPIAASLTHQKLRHHYDSGRLPSNPCFSCFGSNTWARLVVSRSVFVECCEFLGSIYITRSSSRSEESRRLVRKGVVAVELIAQPGAELIASVHWRTYRRGRYFRCNVLSWRSSRWTKIARYSTRSLTEASSCTFHKTNTRTILADSSFPLAQASSF